MLSFSTPLTSCDQMQKNHAKNSDGLICWWFFTWLIQRVASIARPWRPWRSPEVQFSSLSRDRNEPRKRWSQLKQVLSGVHSGLVDISWIIRFFLGFVSTILGLFEAPMEYLDGMDAQRFQYEQRVSGSDTSRYDPLVWDGRQMP